MFKMRQLLLDKKKKELSEYKSIYMIKNYYLLFYEGLHKDIQELLKVFITSVLPVREKRTKISSIRKENSL